MSFRSRRNCTINLEQVKSICTVPIQLSILNRIPPLESTGSFKLPLLLQTSRQLGQCGLRTSAAKQTPMVRFEVNATWTNIQVYKPWRMVLLTHFSGGSKEALATRVSLSAQILSFSCSFRQFIFPNSGLPPPPPVAPREILDPPRT